MKLISLLIGAALGVAGGMYWQKKKDEKACPALPKPLILTEMPKDVLPGTTGSGGAGSGAGSARAL